MKTSTLRTIRIVAGIVTFLSISLIAWLLLTNNGCTGGVSFDGFGFARIDDPADFAESGAYEVTDTISHLEVEWTSGRLTIEVDDGDTIRFSESAKRPISEHDALRYAVRDGALTIIHRQLEKTFFSFNFNEKNLTLLWPRTRLSELETVILNTVSARLEMPEMEAKESIRIESVSGAQMLGRVATPTFDTESVSGEIKAASIAAERISFEPVSGRIDAAVRGARNIDADSVSGSVTLTLQGTARANVEYGSVSGEQRADDSIVIASDADLRIRVNTVSGDLQLKGSK